MSMAFLFVILWMLSKEQIVSYEQEMNYYQNYRRILAMACVIRYNKIGCLF
ncbi:hypothetical protein JCM31739_16720 [Faecalimonas canis]